MKSTTVFWIINLVVACTLRCAMPATAQEKPATPITGKIIAGYFPSWEEFSLKDSQVKQLSHLLYAFGAVSTDGLARPADPCADMGICANSPPTSGQGGNFLRLSLLKRENPHLRILISLGGWSGSKYFSNAATTSQSRERFAKSILDVFFRPYPGLFDGIDIDWEYPVAGGAEGNVHRPQDAENFIALMAEIRRQLTALSATDGHHYELATALAANPETVASLDLKKLSGIVDWIGVMTYDYNTSEADYNAPLFSPEGTNSVSANVDSSIRYFFKSGVPPEKLLLGIPFYGRAYRGVLRNGNGRIQAGKPATDWGGEDGIGYKDILLRRPETRGFTRGWDEKAQVPWLYNEKQQIWISYDDADSVSRKAIYVRSHGLAGAMIWEISSDDGSLLPALSRALMGQTQR